MNHAADNQTGIMVFRPAPEPPPAPAAPTGTEAPGGTGSPPPPAPPPVRRSVVFVPGFFSTAGHAFDEMTWSFRRDERLDGWELDGFGYDFNEPLRRSGEALARALRARFGDGGPNDRVVLVCHGTGGLVARLAVMDDRLPFVRRVVMLGTPNFGVLRASQMGLLATFAVNTAGRLLWGLFPRKTGVRDVSRIDEVLRPYVTDPERIDNAAHVEYVTIPGTYFDVPGKGFSLGERERDAHWMLLFSSLNLGAGVWDSLTPAFMNVKFEMPNDGLVEETSNRLDPVTNSGRYSEKMRAINGQVPDGAPKTYLHARPVASDGLTHVTLHRDAQIIGHVKDLVLADNLAAWHAQTRAGRALFYKTEPY
jgi:Alpha/beta hydrolase